MFPAQTIVMAAARNRELVCTGAPRYHQQVTNTCSVIRKQPITGRGIQKRKTNVAVTAHFDEDGLMKPVAVHWDDGRTFEIDRVLDMRQAAALKVGGTGIRYLIRVGQVETFLWYEGPRWFVEERLPAPF